VRGLVCLLICTAAVLSAAPPARAAGARSARRPNVVIIFVDDLGAADAGCYGANDLRTPNIDAIATHGVRFTNFYAASPVCSPSRAALLTGRYPLRAGLTNNAASQRGQKGGLPVDQVTIAQSFKAAGYATAHIGKWHLGYTPDTMPNARGFDLSFGHMGGCIDNWSQFFYWSGPNIHDLWLNGTEIHEEGHFFPDMMVERAGRFIEANKDKPFLLYFAMNMPHYPYQPDVKWIDYYNDLPMPRRLYAAFVSTMDDRIGLLLKTLDDLHLRDDTIVVFQSDNGHSTEDRAFSGGGSAGPYRGAKFSLFEGGIHLPGMISWPAHLPENQIRGQLAHGCDWLPTVAELCGVKLLEPDIDGRSLVSVIKSPDAKSPHEILHFQMGDGTAAQWAVRDGDWKLIGNAWDTTQNASSKERIKLFLSNLAKDIGEKKNFAAENPDIVERLGRLHEQWVRQVTESRSAPKPQ
jgi:arylsulfatase A